MKSPVVIVPYDPQWPGLFKDEKARIARLNGIREVTIEHIGSTAVPGLGAKPILDIMIGVRTLFIADECIKPLESIGYRYVPEFEASIPERRFLWKGTQAKRTHHIHIVEKSSDFWERHLLFRDYLRTHPTEAENYYKLKTQMAETYGSDRDGYTDAKSLFIESIIEKAGKDKINTHDKDYNFDDKTTHI